MITVSVCIGSACHLKGSYSVISRFQELVKLHKLSDAVKIEAVFCLGHCSGAVSVKINDGPVESVSGKTAWEYFNKRVLPLAGEKTGLDKKTK